MSSPTVPPSPTPSSPPPSPTPAPLALLQTAARTNFVGLLWGGVLLIILALWLGLKYAGEHAPWMPWIIGLTGGAGLGLAGWHAFVLWLQKTPPDQKAVALAAQRRTTGLALLGIGVLLLVLSIILGFVLGPIGSSGMAVLRANFGEAVGLFLFALVTLAAGRAMLAPPHADLVVVDLEPVRGLFPLIRTVLFLTGAVLVVLFAVLAFYYRIGAGYFPELAGILLFSMLCLALALWLISMPAPDPFTTRVFVLVFGGLTGLILFVMTLARAVAWREQVFFSGINTWQGEGAWRLWLCVYLQMIALALMFGSLLLARGDIRVNPLLRRVLFGYSTVLNGLLLLEMLIVLNIVLYALVPYTFDWTRSRGLYNLAESSKNLLRQLKQPTEIYVLLSPGFGAYTEVRNLMDNLQAESNKVRVEYISPDQDVNRYTLLSQRFPDLLPPSGLSKNNTASGRGILMVYGELPKDKNKKVPYAFLAERKIFEETPAGMHGGKATRSFKGEIEVMRELNFLVHGQAKRKVFFLQGDGEIDVSNPDIARRLDLRAPMNLLGASTLVDRLKKENYVVEAVTFSKEFAAERKKEKETVRYLGGAGKDAKLEVDTKDVQALVIAGASSPLSDEALAAVEKYVERGGKLLVTFDVVLSKDRKTMLESGVEGLLRKFGIESADEFALSVPRNQFSDPLKVLAVAPLKTENALAKQFLDQATELRSVRVVRPAAAGKAFKAEVLLESLLSFQNRVLVLAERNVAGVIDPMSLIAELDQNGQLLERVSRPQPLAVTVSEGEKPRMVVFGDTEFISNEGLTRDRARDTNYSLFVSALEWMAEREGLVGPRPKETQNFALNPKVGEESTRIHFVPMWLMLLTVIGLGMGIWLVRRR